MRMINQASQRVRRFMRTTFISSQEKICFSITMHICRSKMNCAQGKTERLNLIVPTQINIRDNAPTKPWQWRHSATRYIKQLTWRLLSLGIALAKLNDTYTSWSISDMLKNFNTRTTSIWKIRLASSGPNGSSPRLSGLASSLIIWGPTTYRVYCIPQRVLRRGKRDS